MKHRVRVYDDPHEDLAEIFTTSEQVNKALRALVEAVPRVNSEKAA